MYHNITAAVAGTGFIGPVHIEALKRLSVRVKGVLGSTSAKSVRTMELLGLEKAYGDYQDILDDDDVQVVHLAVPNVLHFEMAKKALLAGKHVMCEKPLAMAAIESKELVDMSQSLGLIAGVCYNIRFYPLNIEARKRILSGAIGDIFSVKGSYVQDWLMYPTDYNWRVLAEKGGPLRAIADIGTHWMDLLTSITGLQVEAVFADLHTVHPIRKRPKGEVKTFSDEQLSDDELEPIHIDTEDGGSILFRFSNGVKGSMWVSQITAGRKNCLQYEIAGSQASLSWNSERPNEIFIGHRDAPNEVLMKDPGLVDRQTSHYINYPGGHNEGFPDSFKQCFRAFYDAIIHNIPTEQALYPTFEQGHKEVVLCEAILRSHRESRWIHLI